ncbi:MAG: sugar nucleotide-binding protein [Clostridium sp.]|uniref:sugar nucleotide-binding protein n=1 Tax=Clostridium sp. TaxID=1506 RepID=UPI00306CBF73
MNKVLVLGGSGLVGKAIINELNGCNEFQVYGTYYKHPKLIEGNMSFKLDLEDLDNAYDMISTLKPEIIISCLRGDFDKQLVFHEKIAEYLKAIDGRLYFFSTTNVFDNNLIKPHYEDEFTNSCTDYGKYKIKCEKIILKILQNNACILRLPQVWGKDCVRMKQLRESLINNEKIVVYPKLFLNVVTDVIIAKKISYIMENKMNGIFHIATEDILNHKDFFEDLVSELEFNNSRIEEDFGEEGYFAILSNRSNEFPKELSITTKSVIKELIR